ncbi:hypothetical protein [Streptomyces arenae]|uniref:hypothetical protein n=1 Tax=Streptomyces arenae TaxID=29301 RepID=UPI00265947C5|nr:hypothetical protein [Streptomyces arenae]MCG7203975.1 hypothetical protein [Streptomyces arenae]
MTAPEEQPAEAEQETAGEEDESTGRGPAVALTVLGAVAAWRLIATFPEVALAAAGSLGTIGVQQARARWATRGAGTGSEGEDVEPPDVGEALRRLVGDDKGVLLTVLQKDLGLPDTKAVKALLEAEGIPWKSGRTREGNGPSVRAESIPPAPSPAADSHGDGCCCRSGDNNNANTTVPSSAGERSRVRRIRSARALYDPNDNVRRHTSTKGES